jgi:hypothetical protein
MYHTYQNEDSSPELFFVCASYVLIEIDTRPEK